MCGIHGVITSKKRENNADDFIKQGFITGTLRGTDSSGLASIKTVPGEATYQKLPVNGAFFMTDKYAATLARTACEPYTVSIGHTRAATSGPIGLSEAHPFFIGDDERQLIGVHNGSLTGWQSKPYGKDYKVDSEWALSHIYTHGKEAFKDFTGAFVFVWWDSADKDVVHIALNDARPLFVAFTTEGNMLFASEAGMLYWLAERNSMKLEGKVRKLLSNFWYQFRMEDLIDYVKEALPVKAAAPVKTVYNNGSYTNSGFVNRDHVSAVTRILDDIKDKDTSKPTPLLLPMERASNGYVKAEEILLAKERHLSRVRGTFLPYWTDEDTGEIWGQYASVDGVEMDGIIRNGKSLDYDVESKGWVVEIIGMTDDGTHITVICTHPITTVDKMPELVLDPASA